MRCSSCLPFLPLCLVSPSLRKSFDVTRPPGPDPCAGTAKPPSATMALATGVSLGCVAMAASTSRSMTRPPGRCLPGPPRRRPCVRQDGGRGGRRASGDWRLGDWRLGDWADWEIGRRQALRRLRATSSPLARRPSPLVSCLAPRRSLARRADPRDRLHDRHFVAGGEERRQQRAFDGAGHFHRRLVGLDLAEYVVDRHRIADLLLPVDDDDAFDGVALFGHHDGCRHSRRLALQVITVACPQSTPAHRWAGRGSVRFPHAWSRR